MTDKWEIIGEMTLNPEAYRRQKANRLHGQRCAQNGGSYSILYPAGIDKKIHGGYACSVLSCINLTLSNSRKNAMKYRFNESLLWAAFVLVAIASFCAGYFAVN